MSDMYAREKKPMRTYMKVLSLTQPWASLVVCGAKAVETRSWEAPRRAWGMPDRYFISSPYGNVEDAYWFFLKRLPLDGQWITWDYAGREL